MASQSYHVMRTYLQFPLMEAGNLDTVRETEAVADASSLPLAGAFLGYSCIFFAGFIGLTYLALVNVQHQKR